MKSVPFAVALLASALATSAFADDQLNKLNNQVYFGVAAEPTTIGSVQTLRAADQVYMAVDSNIDGKGSSRNAHAGLRWQAGTTGLFLEGQARRSSGTLDTTQTFTGAKNAPAPTQHRQTWSRDEALGNIGWAFSFDGGGMQATPYLTFGSTSQNQFADYGSDYLTGGSVEQRVKSSFVGVGFRHQTSLTPTLALEVDLAYERHNISWDQISLNVFGQPDGSGGSIAVKHGDGARVALGLSQQLWKNVRVNYGIRYSRLSASGEFAGTPVSFDQDLTSVSLGLGVSF